VKNCDWICSEGISGEFHLLEYICIQQTFIVLLCKIESRRGSMYISCSGARMKGVAKW
jgi:hypothetical protein